MREMRDDDTEATSTGTWDSETAGTGYEGTDYRSRSNGDGTESFTWTPTLTTGGAYQVYAKWPADQNRGSAATYTVHHAGGATEVALDQRADGGAWNLLGNFVMTPSQSHRVVMTDEVDDVSASDAVVDNSDTATSWVGSWPTSTGLNGGRYVGPHWAYHASGTGDNSFTWPAAVAEAGSYKVYARWVAASGYATNAKYTVHHGAGTTTKTVSQRINGGRWMELGTFDLDPAADHRVVLSDDADSTWVIADAVRYVRDGSATGTGEIIVDNTQAAFTGTWGTTSPALVNAYGTDHRWHASGSGSNTVTWTPAIPATDNYKVYAWWPSASNRAPDAKYTIHHSGGSTTVAVDQRVNGAEWVALGTYAMAPSSSHRVVLTDNAGGTWVMADAIRLVREPVAEPAVIVDNPQATYAGTWGTATGYVGMWAADSRWHATGSGANTATWTPALPQTASYKVYAWWKAATNRATNAPYTIHHSGGSTTVTVDQEQNGSRWNLLGTFALAPSSSHRVVLSDNANEYVFADAVKFVLDDTVEGDIVIDDQDPEASRTGTWLYKTWTGGGRFWNTNYYRTDAVGLGATHTWTPAIPATGRYRIYTRWAASAGYASNAPFTVHHAGGSTLVRMDQRIDGGQWKEIGEFDMAPGQSHRVVLTDDAAAKVVADAVRLVHIGDTRRVVADAVKFVANDAEDVLYVHADHLGGPRKMTANSGAVAWDAAFTPFGLEDSITGTEANDNRFPGQRFDAETALHYNYFRDYDPSVGRYVQSDPIGLEGGLNTYAYVGGNPVHHIDSLGLRVLNPNNFPVDKAVIDKLEKFNSMIGCQKDIVITGGNRSPNSKLGAGSKSTHGRGLAADIHVPGQTHLETANQGDQSGLWGGVGWYEEGYRGPKGEGPHVHVDIRNSTARWGYSKNGQRYRGYFPKTPIPPLNLGSCGCP